MREMELNYLSVHTMFCSFLIILQDTEETKTWKKLIDSQQNKVIFTLEGSLLKEPHSWTFSFFWRMLNFFTTLTSWMPQILYLCIRSFTFLSLKNIFFSFQRSSTVHVFFPKMWATHFSCICWQPTEIQFQNIKTIKKHLLRLSTGLRGIIQVFFIVS